MWQTINRFMYAPALPQKQDLLDDHDFIEKSIYDKLIGSHH